MALRPLFVLCMCVIMKPFQRIVIMYTRKQFHSCTLFPPSKILLVLTVLHVAENQQDIMKWSDLQIPRMHIHS